tara:strand:+ start:18231 stop:18767 length:537 start_codon:yes stop_codon:yes gene_type:complete
MNPTYDELSIFYNNHIHSSLIDFFPPFCFVYNHLKYKDKDTIISYIFSKKSALCNIIDNDCESIDMKYNSISKPIYIFSPDNTKKNDYIAYIYLYSNNKKTYTVNYFVNNNSPIQDKKTYDNLTLFNEVSSYYINDIYHIILKRFHKCFLYTENKTFYGNKNNMIKEIEIILQKFSYL